MKLYTENQIREAFFKQFREVGELWFPYNSDGHLTEDDINAPVQQEFDEFMEKLNSTEMRNEPPEIKG